MRAWQRVVGFKARAFGLTALSTFLVAGLPTGRSGDDARRGEQQPTARAPQPVIGKPWIGTAETPPVQMFVPGFTVRQLPVDLTNINNVQYRADGKLVALAYNGNVYLLSDTDGDGLEDRAELFWENKGGLRAPIGMALTPPGYPQGDGLFVASKGKCSLLVDTHGTGKADREIIVAQGWQEIPHGVDALGVASRTQGEQLLVGDRQGQVTAVRHAEMDEMHSAPQSVMPEGLPQLLGPERTRDLLTFLLTEPPHMPDYGKGTPPAPRSRREVDAVLAGAPETLKTRPLHIVLVAGKKDHGPGEHDYPAWQKVWQKLLAMAADTKVTTANDWPEAADLQTADVLVFYQQGRWTPDRARAIDAFLARGGGLVYIHYAVDGGKDAPGFAQRIGVAWQGGRSRFRHGPLDLDFRPGKGHPIARNFDKVHFHDESYWALVGDVSKVRLLATGVEEGREQPLFWALEPSCGRVFVSIPGHFAWTFDDPLFRTLLLRGIAWAGREPVDRFNELVTPGARLKD
jgi:type 1 glutamine amidotransferase